MSKNHLTFLSILVLWGSSHLLLAQSSYSSKNQSLTQGIQLFESGAYQEAIPILEKGSKESVDKKDITAAYFYLAQAYLYTGKIKESTQSYEQANQMAYENGFLDFQLKSAEALGEIYTFSQAYQKSIEVLRPSIHPDVLDKNVLTSTTAMTTIGLNYLRLGVLDSAQWYMEEALKIKTEKGDTTELVLHYNHLANLYSVTGDLVKAISYNLKTLPIFERENQRQQMVASFHNIASIFHQQNNQERAEEYALKGIEIARKEKNLPKGLGAMLQILGDIKSNRGQNKEALAYYLEALGYVQSRATTQTDFFLVTKIGTQYLKLGAFELSESILKKGLQEALSKNEKRSIIELNLSLIKLYFAQNKSAEVKIHLDNIQNELRNFETLRSHLKFHQVEVQYYQLIENDEKALQAFRQLESIKKRLQETEQGDKVQELEERYERAKKNKEIAELNAATKVKDLSIKQSIRNRIIATIGLILISFLGILLYIINRTRKSSNQKLANKNTIISNSLAEKETLLKEIHHRVKNNLQVVSSLLRLQSRYIKDEKALDAIQEGRNRVKSMSLIHQNLYQTDNLTGIDVDQYVERLCENLFQSYQIDKNRIQFSKNIDSLNIDVDTIIPLGLILNELLTNSLKYAFDEDEKGKVSIVLQEKKDHLFLEVTDDGKITTTQQQKSGEEGGFGMKLVEAFAKKLHAKTEFFQGNGTTVRLFIKNYKLV